ncbi:MAG: hypothetical protein ACYTGW_00270 [Planctomycetota bacterium]|jgi:hypothetical protein
MTNSPFSAPPTSYRDPLACRWSVARTARAAALGLVTTLLVLASAGCSTPPKEGFSHQFHRSNYRLSEQEIKDTQFYISAKVLAQTVLPSERNEFTGTNAILVARGTPGVVTEVGPDWIRVSFRKGSKGVPFLADASGEDVIALYTLATTVEGEDGLRKVADVPGYMAIHEGVRYRVLWGYDAYLMIDTEELEALINKRMIGPGRIKAEEDR